MIIVTTDEQKSSIIGAVKKRYPGYQVISDLKKDEYRCAEKRCFIVTDHSACRGTDFRISEDFKLGRDYNPEQGIDLLLTTDLSNERAFYQCAGRVGRHTEHCGRYKYASIPGYKECCGQNAYLAAMKLC